MASSLLFLYSQGRGQREDEGAEQDGRKMKRGSKGQKGDGGEMIEDSKEFADGLGQDTLAVRGLFVRTSKEADLDKELECCEAREGTFRVGADVVVMMVSRSLLFFLAVDDREEVEDDH